MTPTPEQIEEIDRAVLRRIAELRDMRPLFLARHAIELRALEAIVLAVTGEKG
jgi:hypothetical protein